MYKNKRIISFVLVLCFLVSLVAPAQKAKASTIYSNHFSVNEETFVHTEDDMASVSLKSVFNGLDPEAQEIFLSLIASDNELAALHTREVDPAFEFKRFTYQKTDTKRANINGFVKDPLEQLSRDLMALGLPDNVRYSLMSFASGIFSAAADGTLPVGDILLLASSLSLVITLAFSYNDIYENWDGIVNGFKKAFYTASSNIQSAFSSIKSDVKQEIDIHPVVSLKGNVVLVNGLVFRCTDKAQDVCRELSEKKKGKYHVAALIGGTLWVCPEPVETKVASWIRAKDLWNIGCFATLETYAKGICGAYPIYHTAHYSNNEGYFPHYHPSNGKDPGNFHCWFYIH